jgi:DNA-binding PadR family transcriptional regulator
VNGLWKFSAGNGKERGLLALFILHSLDREPKSGYTLLKEITDKTEGLWVPSKGTLYPVLRQLEEDSLIHVVETGTRSKNIFEPTDTGRETLRSIKERKKESREKLLRFSNLLGEIFGKEKMVARGLLFDIREAIEDISPGRVPEAVDILERCVADLRRIEPHGGSTC